MIDDELIIQQKKCTKCGLVKPLSEYYYHTLRGKYVPHSECKECTKQRVKNYRSNHPINKDVAKIKSKIYYDKNKDIILQKCKDSYPRRKLRVHENNKDYYIEHHDEICQKRKQYRQDNKDKINTRMKQYYHCHPEKAKTKYQKRKDKIKESSKARYARIKLDVMMHYGNGICTCVHCGFNDIRALTIDHINGNGADHRKDNKDIRGNHIYWWLIKNGYPEGYQTLCMNCQLIKKYNNKEYYKNGIKQSSKCTENASIYYANRKIKIKTDVLTHYGDGKCTCIKCGFSNIVALTIDHMNGNGAEHRKENRYVRGSHVYEWLRKNNFPDGYQTLCMNCNFIKRYENNELNSLSKK